MGAKADLKPEDRLVQAGWSYVLTSWSVDIYRHEQHGQMSQAEAIAVIEAEDG